MQIPTPLQLLQLAARSAMKMDPLKHLEFVKKNIFRHCCLKFLCGNSADENCHFPTSIVGSSHRRDPETVSSVTTTTRAPNKFTVDLEFKLMFRNWSRMADRRLSLNSRPSENSYPDFCTSESSKNQPPLL